MPRGKKSKASKPSPAAAAAASTPAPPAAAEGTPEFFKELGNAAFARGDFVEAVAMYTKAIELNPEEKVFFSNRSCALLPIATPEAFAQALHDADRCIELDRMWVKGHFRKGNALRAVARFHDAEEAFRQGLQLDEENRDIRAALTELKRLSVRDAMVEVADETSLEKDKFDELTDWLLASGAQFPLLYMKRYSEHNRGVHCRVDVAPEQCIMSIPKKCLITVEMGKATEVGRKMLDEDVDVTAVKHCYLCVFVLQDMKNPRSFFQPYYRVLPSSYPNMPIFWGPDQLRWLEGSYMLTQIRDRIKNIEADYDLICSVAPEFGDVATVEEFKWARMMVASRNFGITVDGIKTDALVPYADMLNHYRPRETRWAFSETDEVFTIHSLEPLRQGQQVYDSYGKKCNSRFLLNYGFAVENNRDPDGTCHNEVRLEFDLAPDDPHAAAKRGLLQGCQSNRGYRVSMHHDGPDATIEAYSYLRFIHARGQELLHLPPVDDDVDLAKQPINPVSIENELAVLETLAAKAREQLTKYTRTVEEDDELLRPGVLPFGSNERNCAVVLKGEKEVCLYLMRQCEEASRVLRMEWKDCKKEVNKRFRTSLPQHKALEDYVQKVVVPLARKNVRRA